MPIQPEPTEDETSFDDLLSSMGMDDKSITSEDMFFTYLTEGKYQKIHNLRYWLVSEIAKFQFLAKENVKITKHIYDKEKRTIIDRPLTNIEFAKIQIKYYLQMYHLPWFEKIGARKPCDMEIMLGRIAEHSIIAETIVKNYLEND